MTSCKQKRDKCVEESIDAPNPVSVGMSMYWSAMERARIRALEEEAERLLETSRKLRRRLGRRLDRRLGESI